MDRLKQWLPMGIALLVLGIILHFSHGKSITRENPTICFRSDALLSKLNMVLSHVVAAIPLNKQLYTFSYICVTAGAAGIVFSMLYFLVSSCSW
jgi:heparan-alpha-glucosaminide N-acetyltransferase